MSPRTVYAALEQTARKYPNAPALQQPLGKGKYQCYTYKEYQQAVVEVATGLRSIGVARGEIVALFSETRAEFYIADIGIMSAGAISAALYTSYPIADLVANLRASNPRFVFVENPKSLRSLIGAAGDQTLSSHWILLSGEDPDAITLVQLREKGRQAIARDSAAFEKIRAEVGVEDNAILYLTSGATGEPKMGLVNHRALVTNMDHGPQMLPLDPGDSALVFLPSAHIAQRVVLELLPIPLALEIWFSEGLAKMPNELKTIRPAFFLAPPRVWERVFTSIHTEVKKKSPLQQRIFHGAVGLGAEASRLQQAGKPVPGWMKGALKVADKLVFSKIRERLGGRLKVAASGAAPLGKELGEFYAAIGMPLIEGYGLTEAGVVSLNPLDRPKIGSIGKALPGVEVKLAADGELLVHGPTVFSGYYNDPVATAAVLTDGWLATGDVAEIDDEGFIFITGRKKELIVSSNGKKIYPSRIEGLFKTDPLVNQVLLIGDKLPYVTALITVNVASAESLQGMEGLRGRPAEEIAVAEPVVAQIQKTVAKVNKQLPSFEQIRKFRVLEKDFSIEAGELTPTMKVRRGRVLENYRELVSDLYLGKEEMQ
jgi:long-chain acyl-CoA synthetase